MQVKIYSWAQGVGYRQTVLRVLRQCRSLVCFCYVSVAVWYVTEKTAVFSASRVKTQFYASETALVAEKQCLFSDSCHCAAGMRAGLCWLLSA